MASVDDSEPAAFAKGSSDISMSSSVAVGSLDTPDDPYNATVLRRLSCTTSLPLKRAPCLIQRRGFFPGLERTRFRPSGPSCISPGLVLVSATSQRHSFGAVHGYVIPLLSPRFSLRPSFSSYGSSRCPAWIQVQEKEFFSFRTTVSNASSFRFPRLV